MRRCPACGHFATNHSHRGCYAGPDCTCKRKGLELEALSDAGLEVVVPFPDPGALAVLAELEERAARIRASLPK